MLSVKAVCFRKIVCRREQPFRNIAELRMRAFCVIYPDFYSVFFTAVRSVKQIRIKIGTVLLC